MRFVAPKSEQTQAAALVFRARDLLVRQRTQVINALRGHLAEFGIVVAKGPAHVPQLVQAVENPDEPLPEIARPILQILIDTLHRLDEQIALLDREIVQRAKADETAHRLMTIPGIGPVTAVALTALAPPAQTFRRGRDFAAWVGLTPLQHSTGGKQKLGATSKMGERTLRRLLIIGASAVLRWAARHGAPAGSWIARMLACKPPMLVRVALANKMARIVWALMAKGGTYQAPAAAHKGSRLWGRWGVGRSKERDGATVIETGSGKPALRQALQARGTDLDLIRELPSGPAACEPHQRPHTCQHPTARCTNPEDSSCAKAGVHTCS